MGTFVSHKTAGKQDTYDNNGYTHQSQKFLTFFVVFFRDLDCASGEPVYVLRRSRLLRFLAFLLGLFSPFKPLRQLEAVCIRYLPLRVQYRPTHHSRFQLWGTPVEHVGWLNAILDDPDSPIEKPHQVASRLPSIIR